MSTITTRAGKGSPLSNTEVDANFTNLNNDKYQQDDDTQLSSIKFTGSSTDEGVLSWNESKESVELTMGNGVVQQVGEEVYFPKSTRNLTGSSIPNGTPVMIGGYSGSDITIVPAIADGSIPADKYLGIATETIANGDYGRILFFGFISDIDTSAYSQGDILYVSPDTAGALTATKPDSPDLILTAGVVVESSATVGKIAVRYHEMPISAEVSYDNTFSTLIATNVQAALDELQNSKASAGALSSNINLFPTTASSDVTGYTKLVSSVDDADYDDTAVNVATGSIGTTETQVGALISEAGLVDGSLAGVSVTVVGNIRKTAGNNNEGAYFYFKVFHRNSSGTETELSESTHTATLYEAPTYEEFSASAYIATSTTFTSTDRIVYKFYAVGTTTASTYDFQFGGSSPIRCLLPVPVSVIPNQTAAETSVSTTAFAGLLGGSDSNVQAALDTLDDHNHDSDYVAVDNNTLFQLKNTVVANSTSTYNIDFLEQNYIITLVGDVTLTLSNISASVGATGTIVFKQDATGGHTITFPSQFKTPRAETIVQETDANDISAVNYFVVDGSTVLINYIGSFG